MVADDGLGQGQVWCMAAMRSSTWGRVTSWPAGLGSASAAGAVGAAKPASTMAEGIERSSMKGIGALHIEAQDIKASRLEASLHRGTHSEGAERRCYVMLCTHSAGAERHGRGRHHHRHTLHMLRVRTPVGAVQGIAVGATHPPQGGHAAKGALRDCVR